MPSRGRYAAPAANAALRRLSTPFLASRKCRTRALSSNTCSIYGSWMTVQAPSPPPLARPPVPAARPSPPSARPPIPARRVLRCRWSGWRRRSASWPVTWPPPRPGSVRARSPAPVRITRSRMYAFSRPNSISAWLPGLAVTGEVGQRVDVLRLVDVAGRGGEGGVRLEADHHPFLVPDHALDLRELGGRHLLTGHQVDDLAQHVDGLVEVVFDRGIPVDLQVGQRPLLVEDAEADLRVPAHSFGLAAGRHGRDQQVIAVQDVVHDRHGGPVVLAVVPENACPVLPHELATLGCIHTRPLPACNDRCAVRAATQAQSPVIATLADGRGLCQPPELSSTHRAPSRTRVAAPGHRIHDPRCGRTGITATLP